MSPQFVKISVPSRLIFWKSSFYFLDHENPRNEFLLKVKTYAHACITSDLVEYVQTQHVRMTMISAMNGQTGDIARAKSTRDT